MDKPERGQRAVMGIYDDACGFTDEEIKTYSEMLSKDSVDTGINIFDDRLWIEGDDGAEMIVPPPSYFHDKFTAEIHSKIMNLLTPEQWKSLEDEVLKDVAGWGVNNFEPSECEILGNKFDNTNLMEK